ncbi:hypothetical protein [Paraburkholderia sp. CI3]|uniref:hypothetical protein n=1 Tax=Paraburkholderia sp. CI3 TaxID=2991060 RepID=UPI003D234931
MTMTFTSLIGEARLTPEQLAEDAARKEQLGKYTAVLDVLISAYGEGLLPNGLEALGNAVKHIVRDFPERGRHEWLGYAFDRALSMDPPKRGRGQPPRPTAYLRLIQDLVDAVNRTENLAIADAKGVTACARVAEILEAARFRWKEKELTADQVKNWYYEE